MNRQAGISKGCGFVFFAKKQQAQAAIDDLHDKHTMPVIFGSFFRANPQALAGGCALPHPSWKAAGNIAGVAALSVTIHCLAL